MCKYTLVNAFLANVRILWLLFVVCSLSLCLSLELFSSYLVRVLHEKVKFALFDLRLSEE